MNTELRQKIDEYFTSNADAIFDDLAKLVAIKSVRGEPEEGAPYGRGPREALDCMLAISERDGFKPVNCGDQMGYESCGEGEKYITAVAHLDVVPAGSGWNTDPFTMTEREGFVLGRGVADDKGGAVLSHYALKFLRDNDIPLRYETRVLYGTNEETGMADIEFYKKHHPEPALAIAPDTIFPGVFAEKGVSGGFIYSGKILENIVDFTGGEVINQIAGKAEATVRFSGELVSTEAVKVEKLEDGLWKLTSFGKAKHSCLPQRSVNAIGVMAKYLLENGAVSENEERYLRAILPLLTEIHGESFGLNLRDDVFPGSTTIVGTIIRTENGELAQSYRCYYVSGLSGQKVEEAVKKGVGDYRVEMTVDTPIFNSGRDNPALILCRDIYRSYVDDPNEPIGASGGTYARHFKNAFAFGPLKDKPGYPEFVGDIHSLNEGIPKEQLLMAGKIYTAALIELQQLDFE